MTKKAKNVQTTLHIEYCKDASGIGLWRKYVFCKHKMHIIAE